MVREKANQWQEGVAYWQCPFCRGYLRLNNARYNCAIESAARVPSERGETRSRRVANLAVRLWTPITVGRKDKRLFEIWKLAYSHACWPLDGNDKQRANKQLTCYLLHGQRGWAGQEEQEEGCRTAAHVCAVINNPNAVFDSCDPQLARIDFAALDRHCLSRCNGLKIRDSREGWRGGGSGNGIAIQ